MTDELTLDGLNILLDLKTDHKQLVGRMVRWRDGNLCPIVEYGRFRSSIGIKMVMRCTECHRGRLTVYLAGGNRKWNLACNIYGRFVMNLDYHPVFICDKCIGAGTPGVP